ncbi:MAG: hypothetical protein JNK26_03850 [Candidatus Doudnabacteria bacterium]|nr:hypothetical protein [Candidatus Doudnabacteria bacterium]
MYELKQIIEQLKKLPFISPKYCDNCGAKHSEEDFRFLGNNEGNFLFQIQCKACNLNYMMRVNPSMSGLAAQKLEVMNLDLQPEEFKKFAGKPKVDKEEALKVYTDMRKVKTIEDFLKLVSPSD